MYYNRKKSAFCGLLKGTVRIAHAGAYTNSKLACFRESETMSSVLEQEQVIEHNIIVAVAGNWVRLTGIFGLIIVTFFFFLTLLFNFSNRAQQLVLFSVLHFLLAPLAIFVVPLGGCFAVVIEGLFGVQLVLDIVELIMRVMPITADSFLELREIGELLFIFINLLLIIVDLAYLVTTARLIFLTLGFEQERVADITEENAARQDALGVAEGGGVLSESSEKTPGDSNSGSKARRRLHVKSEFDHLAVSSK